MSYVAWVSIWLLQVEGVCLDHLICTSSYHISESTDEIMPKSFEGLRLTAYQDVAGATVLLVPACGWLIKTAVKLLKQQTTVELKLHDAAKDIEQLKAARTDHDSRIIKVEDAIMAIREAGKRADAMFGEIKESLTQLTRISTLVEGLSAAYTQMLPRPEVEARLRAAEERIKSLEGN